MAGTRLAIQTTVLVQLLGLLWVSVYYGFCRNNCTRGNLTKDLPLVPGLVDKNGGGATTANGAVVEAQLWEEILESLVCLPIQSVFGAFLTTTPTTTTIVADETIPEEDFWWYDMVSSTKLDMTLVVENATELPLWIELLSKELRGSSNNSSNSSSNNSINDEEYIDNENDDESDGEDKLTFSTLLHKNPMGLEIIPPLASLADDNDNNNDRIDPSAILSHYKRHSGSIAEATLSSSEREQQQQRKLVVYIPASIVIFPEGTETIGWRAFDTKPSGKEPTATVVSTTVTTMVLPAAPGTTVASSKLQPLVEDWMARSIQAQQQQQQQDDSVRNKHHSKKSSNNDDDESNSPTQKIRLTREFAMEHFLAVIMPLIFPLLLPFVVSWIKEVKRYKKLTKAKKERLEQTANETKTSAATPSSKIKAE